MHPKAPPMYCTMILCSQNPQKKALSSMTRRKTVFTPEERAAICAKATLPNGDFDYRTFLDLLDAATVGK